MDHIDFDYWSDPLCIWAYVAQPKLEHVLDAWGEQVHVSYHVVPVFGSVVQRFRDGKWAKAGPEGRAETTRRVAAEHGFEVSGACWLGDCPASSWAAGVALEGVFAMEAAGEIEAGKGAAYQLAMRRRFFEDNENVARRRVQLELAEALSVPRAGLESRLDDGSALAALFEDHDRRQRMGIQGSPTFVFDGGRAMLYGNFSEDVLSATVAELVRGLHPDTIHPGTRC